MIEPPKADRFAALDLLRLVAALSVVFFHFGYRGAVGDQPMLDSGYPALAGIAIYGYLGVSLFFLISGFVIAWSAQNRTWITFGIARFARIYPGFVVCMTITALVAAFAADPRFPMTIAQYVANLAIFSPALGQDFVDGVYWSIVMELVFYFWMTIAIMTGQFERRPLALIAGWLAISAANELLIGSEPMKMLFITEHSGWFAAGVLTWHMRKRGISVLPLLLFAASFGMTMLTAFADRAWMVEHYGSAIPALAMPFAIIAVHAIFLGTVALGNQVQATALTLALGGLTYPLYLLHQNIGYLTLNSLTPAIGSWAALGLVITGMLAASYVIWALAERPLHRRLLALLKALVRPLPAHWLQPATLRGQS